MDRESLKKVVVVKLFYMWPIPLYKSCHFPCPIFPFIDIILEIHSEANPLKDFSELLIPNLRLWISLGCSATEKSMAQPVDIDIRIKFIKDLSGWHSDNLEETICYHTIVEQVIASLKDKSFNLIEFLATRIFETIQKHIPKLDGFIEISVTKPNHPVPNIHKGIVFKYCRRVSENSL